MRTILTLLALLPAMVAGSCALVCPSCMSPIAVTRMPDGTPIEAFYRQLAERAGEEQRARDEQNGGLTESGYPTHDLRGNKFPPECQVDMNYLLKTYKVYFVPEEDMPEGFDAVCVDCSHPVPGQTYIKINEKFKDRPNTHYVRGSKVRTEIIRHELCHLQLGMLGKNIYWHNDGPIPRGR